MESRGSSFSEVIGDNVRSHMLELLSSTEDRLKQYEIADELGVSQASVSRATKELREANLIEKQVDGRIDINQTAASGVENLQEAITGDGEQ